MIKTEGGIGHFMDHVVTLFEKIDELNEGAIGNYGKHFARVGFMMADDMDDTSFTWRIFENLRILLHHSAPGHVDAWSSIKLFLPNVKSVHIIIDGRMSDGSFAEVIFIDLTGEGCVVAKKNFSKSNKCKKK